MSWLHRLTEAREHLRIDRVVLGQFSCGSGEMTNSRGIDDGVSNTPRLADVSDQSLVASRRFQHQVQLGRPLSEPSLERRVPPFNATQLLLGRFTTTPGDARKPILHRP